MRRLGVALLSVALASGCSGGGDSTGGGGAAGAGTTGTAGATAGSSGTMGTGAAAGTAGASGSGGAGGAAARDRFGVTMLRPTLAGGQTWFSKWDNGTARQFTGVDPQDAWFDADHGDASYDIDGAGTLRISGGVPAHVRPRSGADHPVAQRRDHDVLHARRRQQRRVRRAWSRSRASNHGTIGRETDNLCDTRGIDARMRYDGHIDFEKETSHPTRSAIHEQDAVGGRHAQERLDRLQAARLRPPQRRREAGAVARRERTARTAAPGSSSLEHVDRGTDFGVGGTPCRSGIDPAMRLTNAPDAHRLGDRQAEHHRLLPQRRRRHDGLVYKRGSIREIVAP